ncbi:hypothetical protein GGH96_003444 [Coemansia sp. RSA 1972]|nr:hypothetical protein GGH96_003444 [Coemansia sp. RSA 1972]
MYKQKPIHYFMRPEDLDSLYLDNDISDNRIVEYFDSKDDIDLTKFAEIVKTKPNCNQKHFIVNKGDGYCAVETDNVGNTYVFSSNREPLVISKLVEGSETIDTLIEEDKRFNAMLAKHVPKPGFKLRDANGEIIPDGKGFSLQIVNDSEEVLDEEETKGLSKEDILYRYNDWLVAFSDSIEAYGYPLYAQPGNADIFECETIDDIVYLKHEGGYLYFATDSNSGSIYIGKAVPTKEQRIEIYYDDDGDIYLTALEGKGSDALYLDIATDDNTIVEYFDSEDDVDLAKFAEIVKTKPSCVQKHFIIYKSEEYRAVETDNVENIYVFSSILRLAKPERQPGFKLRDYSGEIIPDGITFALQILRDREEDENDEDEGEDETVGLSKEELFYCNKDWVGVNNYMDDGKDYFLCAQESNCVRFECETIDDIIYLKYNGGYFYFDIDNKSGGIFIGKAVPTKEQRVQIHYTEDGDICLTAWGGRVYVACEWVKSAYGVVRLDDREEQLRWGLPMKLRLVRL